MNSHSDPVESDGAAPGTAYGLRVAERLQSCTLAGSLPEANAAGEAGSLECGSLVRIETRIEQGVVKEARYRAQGCPATLASASEICTTVTGRSFLEAASLTQAEVCSHLGLVSEKEYAAGIALDALHAALTAALADPGCEVRAASSLPLARDDLLVHAGDRGGVLVGMSGGVDSAVVALLLKEQGFRVVGVTLRLWNDPEVNDERSCCSPENVRRARRVAHSLGIPHVSLDASREFYQDVVEYFVEEYAAGRTPNPCAKCNSRLRLAILADAARRLGLSRVATGHYARLTGSPPRLARGADPFKDQSYVLGEVPPEILEQVMFPLGGMRKPEVRARAAAAGLEGHSAPESQEICFVPDDDHRRFLRARLGPLPGDVVDRQGKAVGRHEGTYNFTVGQRRGLRVAAGEPRYVVAISAPERRVVVGTAREAEVGTVTMAGLVRHRKRSGRPLTVQVRSAGAALPVNGVNETEDGIVVSLAEPASGVAPGQTAALYEEDELIVAGTIVDAEPWAADGLWECGPGG